MGDLRPNLQDISITHGVFMESMSGILTTEGFGILLRLIWFSAARRVWTYSEPDPLGRIPADDESLARIGQVPLSVWMKHKEYIAPCFREEGDFWFLDHNWVAIGAIGTIRPAISAALRSKVMRRDNYRCIYCGDASGPFDLDHIIPVSKGGATVAENLGCACASCNRSKGAKTPEEWIR